MNKKILPYSIGGVVISAIVVALIFWFQPPRKAVDQPGIPITAEALFQAYDTDEQGADALYLGKALEVTGMVTDTDTNQDGQLVVFLDTGNPSGNIVCTFPKFPGEISLNRQVTIKGFCAGMLADVMLTDCVHIPAR